MSTVIYIIAISFQVAGALLLLFFSISTKRQNVIKDFVGKGIIERDNNTNEINYNKEKFIDAYKTAYLSKLAFAYIAIGYALGVFGIVDYDNKVVVLVFILLSTGLIMILTYIAVNCIISKSKIVNKEITNEEIEELGIQPDIENISNDELEIICRINER